MMMMLPREAQFVQGCYEHLFLLFVFLLLLLGDLVSELREFTDMWVLEDSKIWFSLSRI